MQITPLRRDDIPELSRFLIGGFGVPATSSFFSPEVLSWKYFDGPNYSGGPRNFDGGGNPAGDSACSLIARSAGKIIGHLGICFRQFVVPGDTAAPVSTMHAIDWLGSPAHPGSGTMLMLEAFKASKTQFAVGGSAQSQALFPRLGFEPKARVASFRRVLSPFHRLRTTNQGLFRKWAGATRDAASVWRAGRRPSVWRARSRPVQQAVELRPAPVFTEEIDCLPRQPSLRIVTCQRDHRLLNYLLRYPLSGFSGWTIHTSDRMIGFALLKVTSHGRIQLGKIVDCWLDVEDPSCWQVTVAALIDRLRALAADDVKCYASNPSLHSALLRNGFHKSGESNVCIRDKQQLLPRDLPFGLSGFEADGAIH
jgi:hypothetical protein